MKFVKLALLPLALAYTATASAGNYKFVAGDASDETKLCISAVSNNVSKYRKQVSDFAKDTKVVVRKHRLIANNLECNDMNIARFAHNYGADKTADFISRYVRKSVSISRETASIEAPESKSSDKPTVIVVSAN